LDQHRTTASRESIRDDSHEEVLHMSHFEHASGFIHFRLGHTPTDIRVPTELGAARGIINGVLIGAIIWVAIIALGYAVFAVYAGWLGH